MDKRIDAWIERLQQEMKIAENGILHISVGAAKELIELIKNQDDVIQALLKIGYPHNFQREEPWIRNYMYAITDVVKKAVRLNNET